MPVRDVADKDVLKSRDSYRRSAKKYEDPDDTSRFKWYKYPLSQMEAHWQGLIDLIPDNATSILECGCGAGNLAEMLKAQRPDLDYQGFDIVQANVDAAQARVPDYTFRLGNYWDELNKAPSYDFVLSCGVLFTTTGLEDIELLFDLLNARAEYGFACIALRFSKQGISRAQLDAKMAAAIETSTGVSGYYWKGKRDFLPVEVLNHFNTPFYIHRTSPGAVEVPEIPYRLIHPDILGLANPEPEYESLFE